MQQQQQQQQLNVASCLDVRAQSLGHAGGGHQHGVGRRAHDEAVRVPEQGEAEELAEVPPAEAEVLQLQLDHLLCCARMAGRERERGREK